MDAAKHRATKVRYGLYCAAAVHAAAALFALFGRRYAITANADETIAVETRGRQTLSAEDDRCTHPPAALIEATNARREAQQLNVGNCPPPQVSLRLKLLILLTNSNR